MIPKYEYRGFQYFLDYDIDPDDGTRKNWHIVTDPKGNQLTTADIDWSPYRVPTYNQFIEAVQEYLITEHHRSYYDSDFDKRSVISVRPF